MDMVIEMLLGQFVKSMTSFCELFIILPSITPFTLNFVIKWKSLAQFKLETGPQQTTEKDNKQVSNGTFFLYQSTH